MDFKFWAKLRKKIMGEDFKLILFNNNFTHNICFLDSD